MGYLMLQVCRKLPLALGHLGEEVMEEDDGVELRGSDGGDR